jgi:copper homeostasis protein
VIIAETTYICSKKATISHIMTLEICAGSIDSAIAAAQGGAQRIELCSALADGGITPSAGLIRRAMAIGGIDVNVLIRPREGDFLYTAEEVEVMEHDVRLCASYGCNGVVIGALTPQGDVDVDACRRLVAAAGSMEVTFHRAFDLCRDPFDALETIISLGCTRILTSGQAPSALEGAEMLSRLVEKAAGRIIILAGGGVSPDNAGSIVRRCRVTELHASARTTVASSMAFRRADVAMGAPGSDEYSRKTTSPEIVAAILKSMAG